MSGPWLAAVTVNEAGGGVAAVSRLLWRVLTDHWTQGTRLVTLVDATAAATSLESSLLARTRFGVRLAAGQVSGRCDWVLYSHLQLARVQEFVPAMRRKPYVVFLHGIEAWRDLAPSQLTVLNNAALRVANSAYTARRVRARHPSLGEILVCPLSLEPGRVIVEDGPGVAAKEPVVLVVARMQSTERYKGHDQLIEAWPLVRARVPEARLIIAGGGDDLARLQAKAQDIGVAESVEFTGFIHREQLDALYDRAAVFAMPSSGEGFGLVYIEAMARGVPCIGSPSDAASEVIRDGETGYLVEQTNLAALADRLARLLIDRESRARLGAAAMADVRARFTYDRFATDFVRLIDSTAPLASPAVIRGATA